MRRFCPFFLGSDLEVSKKVSKYSIKDQEFVYRLMNMARFRNILVHFYWKVEDERLFKILKENLKDIEIFLEIIKQSYLV